MVVDQKADWARGGQGGENIAANALLYHNLVEGSRLAAALGSGRMAAYYSAEAAKLKIAINEPLLWDESKGKTCMYVNCLSARTNNSQ